MEVASVDVVLEVVVEDVAVVDEDEEEDERRGL